MISPLFWGHIRKSQDIAFAVVMRRTPYPVLLFIIITRLPRAPSPPVEPPAAVFSTKIYQHAIYYAPQ